MLTGCAGQIAARTIDSFPALTADGQVARGLRVLLSPWRPRTVLGVGQVALHEHTRTLAGYTYTLRSLDAASSVFPRAVMWLLLRALGVSVRLLPSHREGPVLLPSPCTPPSMTLPLAERLGSPVAEILALLVRSDVLPCAGQFREVSQTREGSLCPPSTALSVQASFLRHVLRGSLALFSQAEGLPSGDSSQ